LNTLTITERPDGQSPDWVRDAWIGIALQTPQDTARYWRLVPGQTHALGILSRVVALLRGQTMHMHGYMVDGPLALSRLSHANPAAAQWYAENIPGLSAGRMNFVFGAKYCTIQPSATATAQHAAGTETLLRQFSGTPLSVAACWITATFVRIATAALDPQRDYLQVTAMLYQSGTPILAGLLLAAALGIRSGAAQIIFGLVLFDLLMAATYGVAEIFTPSPENFWTCTAAYCVFSVLWATHKVGIFAPTWRKLLAAALVVAVPASAIALDSSDRWFWRLSLEAKEALGLAPPPERENAASYEPFESDLLWGKQTALLEQQIAALRTPPSVTSSTSGHLFGMVVAASGQQDIFSREAHAAADAFARHFGSRANGTIALSNGKPDLFNSPLATQDNILASAKGIAAIADGTHDTTFVYLASHGGRDANLQTDLPDYQTIRPITATTVAQALATAGLTRRIIVVSACYSGTWAKALANDDTILITASASDRTSFGCDDSRELTVFGEAFTSALRKPNLSLKAVFETAKKRVASEEARLGATASLPQAYIGKNLQALWTAEP
jgi:Peptidase C13 family